MNDETQQHELGAAAEYLEHNLLMDPLESHRKEIPNLLRSIGSPYFQHLAHLSLTCVSVVPM